MRVCVRARVRDLVTRSCACAYARLLGSGVDARAADKDRRRARPPQRRGDPTRTARNWFSAAAAAVTAAPEESRARASRAVLSAGAHARRERGPAAAAAVAKTNGSGGRWNDSGGCDQNGRVSARARAAADQSASLCSRARLLPEVAKRPLPEVAKQPSRTRCDAASAWSSAIRAPVEVDFFSRQPLPENARITIYGSMTTIRFPAFFHHSFYSEY